MCICVFSRKLYLVPCKAQQAGSAGVLQDSLNYLNCTWSAPFYVGRFACCGGLDPGRSLSGISSNLLRDVLPRDRLEERLAQSLIDP